MSLLPQAAPSKATVLDDLRVLNEKAAEIASKIRTGFAARNNAHAAGEAKLVCDFQAGIALYIAELMKVHKEKAEIFKSHGMTVSRQKELEHWATLNKIGEIEYAFFNKRCR